jgi:precorrin-2 C(20)-methyltransferase
MGKFWAIGVGPGDPGLLTFKAGEILRLVQVIYHAGPKPDQGRAWNIVRAHIQPDQEIRILLTESMAEVSASDGKAPYQSAVDQIAADCRAGKHVALTTEGDPTLYSTAANVWQLLAEQHPDIPIEIVPGVSSITAAAARVGWPLAQKNEALAALPAGYHAEQLAKILQDFPTVCLLKVSQVLPQVLSFLEGDGDERQAVYLENLGTSQEWVTTNLREALGRKGYFSQVLVRRKKHTGKRADESPVSSGKLSVVGLGPGDPELLTRRALKVLQQAQVIVGYDGYLKLLSSLNLRAELRGSPIGKEKERALEALELARAGKRVALVSSGDAGVYGMGSVLFETAALGRLTTPPTQVDVEIEVVPGVTAATAAAALLGAPLGHDFACVSLSDLLTPWEAIERRLMAVAESDFVLALYNPASRERTWQLPRAREILLQHRQPDTPAGVVDRAYRSGMRVVHTNLGQLTSDGIGMETIVIVGNSQTRMIEGRMVTPRGYNRVAGAESSKPRLAMEDQGFEDSAPATQPNSDANQNLGRDIMSESFTIIERELGPHSLPPWAFAVVRRMIHASADFEFAKTLRYSHDFFDVVQATFHDPQSKSAESTERVGESVVVTDTEMVLTGIRAAFSKYPAIKMTCLINEEETMAMAQSAGLTRAASGIRLAAKRFERPVLVIGNAPTALNESLRLISEGWRPRAIIGMPVGFVGVIEAKQRLLNQSIVPYLTCVGRKGGSAVAAAAVNALFEWFKSSSLTGV